MEKKSKKIQKMGNSLALSLSELKKIGLNRGDYVYVILDGEKLVVAKDEFSSLRPLGISEEEWNDFVSTCLSSKRFKKMRYDEKVTTALQEAIKNWIEEEKKKVLLKIHWGKS